MDVVKGIILFAALALAARAQAGANSAHDLVARAMRAMGGETLLRSIQTIDYTAVGYRDMVEQSVRPTGPYFYDYETIHAVRDYAHHRSHVHEWHSAYGGDKWWLQQTAPDETDYVINDDVAATDRDGKYTYGGGYYLAFDSDQYAFSPEKLLLTAEGAAGLHVLPDEKRNGYMQHVVAYTWNGSPCKLLLNAYTGLPSAVQFVRAYPDHLFLSVWGDVPTTISYEAWNLEPDGLVYPRQWNYERVGLPDQTLSLTQLHLNSEAGKAVPTIPQDLYAAHHGHVRAVDQIPLGSNGSGAPHELAPGVLEWPGGWNVAFVKQNDGIVAIEAPWSPAYAQRAFEAAVQRYGVRIKAVVTTSDSWPHISGVRQAVADGIPVVALDLNRPILERLIAAPHAMHPDALQRNPRAAKFTFVSTPLAIGSGANRLVVIPYRTATAERQMLIWFPERRLLYTSDLFSGDGEGGWFTPEYLHEFVGAVQREHLDPATIFGMHYDATPYATVVKALSAFSAAVEPQTVSRSSPPAKP